MRAFIPIILACLLAATHISAQRITLEKAVKAQNSNAQTIFASYWYSWGQNNPIYQFKNLRDVVSGVNQVFVAFGLERNDQKAIQLQFDDESGYRAFASDVREVKSKGVKVILSSGGATAGYPWEATASDEDVANQYIDFVKKFDLDGIDFDIEAGVGARLPTITRLIRQRLPNTQLSITVPSTGNGGFTADISNLGKKLASQNTLDYVLLMNYDQYYVQPGCTYDNSNLEQNCYVDNLKATINLMASWYGGDVNAAKRHLINGIMIGVADDRKVISPELTHSLTAYLKNNNYGGVMTWALNRDQPGTDLARSTGTNNPPLAYTNTIISALQ
ncbi:hypothetical protein AKO1_008280 [Acrasis kona]|uniref:chitinase n=1 Tax=Acrasis kona TaxID=1008807 RepID=A0AAW2YNU2_9EUKA